MVCGPETSRPSLQAAYLSVGLDRRRYALAPGLQILARQSRDFVWSQVAVHCYARTLIPYLQFNNKQERSVQTDQDSATQRSSPQSIQLHCRGHDFWFFSKPRFLSSHLRSSPSTVIDWKLSWTFLTSSRCLGKVGQWLLEESQQGTGAPPRLLLHLLQPLLGSVRVPLREEHRFKHRS